ncbi:MAG TPA: hypothetical protein VMT32_21740 [Bryobacteraceae bacterium]|nr:hypothetical protein [Bryobacteraceae bacterium]
MRKPIIRGSTKPKVFLVVLFVAGATHALRADSGRTFGTAGKEERVLKAGVEAELFRHTGKGFLTHMWFGGDFRNYGLTRIRVYVDGERQASIDMELMMGHGIGFQDDGAHGAWNASVRPANLAASTIRIESRSVRACA